MTLYGVEAAWEVTRAGGAMAGATGAVTGATGAGAMTVGEDVSLAVTAVLAQPML